MATLQGKGESMGCGQRIGQTAGIFLFIITASFFVGCEGRTGRVGTPITERYSTQLTQLQVGVSTPNDLQAAFHKQHPSLKEQRLEAGHQIAIWQVFRGGDMDTGEFLLWGEIAHDKDQAIEFKFQDGKLISYQSVVYPDPK